MPGRGFAKLNKFQNNFGVGGSRSHSTVSVMGFQKKVWTGQWVNGVNYIHFFRI